MLLVEGDLFPVELKGLERCVICLSDENFDSPDDLEVIPVNVFNKVWNHLVLCEKGKERSFSRAPPVCSECRRRLEKLFGLLNQVEQVTNGIRSVVTDSGKNGCYAEQRYFKVLEEMKDDHLEDKWRRSTLNLLEQLGHGEISEEDYRNWFSQEDKVISDDDATNSSEDQEDNDDCLSEDDIKVNPDEKTDDECFVIETKPIQVHKPPVQTPSYSVVVISHPAPAPNAAQQRSVPNQVNRNSIRQDCRRPSAGPPPASAPPVKQIIVTVPRPGDRSRQGVVVGNSASSQVCDFCGAHVPSKKMLQHMESHVGSYALRCPNPYCDLVYSNISSFRDHIAYSPICKKYYSTLYICEICSHEATNFRFLKCHLKLKHESPVDQPFSCPVKGCTLRFTTRQSVQLHIMSHTRIELRRRGLVTSKKSLGPAEATFSCDYCPSSFGSRLELIQHFNLHTMQGTPVACDICKGDVKYLKPSILRDHYLQEHQVGEKLACEFCPTTCWTEGGLKTHVASFHSNEPPKKKAKPSITCSLCKDHPPLRREADLVAHNIKSHGATPFQCRICNKSFARAATLQQHENSHKNINVTNKLRFNCDLPGCGKAYVTQKKLDQHKMSVEHVGRTNAFVCGDCGKGFNLESHLKLHERKVHTTERKFCCEECGESFKTENVLQTHLLIHSGERPFACDLCGQRFRQKVVLTRHLQGHKEKGQSFKPNGPMKGIRKRVNT